MREWKDQRAHHLYSLAAGPGDRKVRDEAMLFLWALVRAGSTDAAWALSALKKREGPEDRV